MDTLSESFGYDDFSLTRTTVSGQPSDTISYDLAGNITYKSDIGDYRYVINRLDSIIAKPTAIPLTNQSLTYTAENLTESITQNENLQMHFLYGPGNQRIRSVLTNESDTVKVKYYSGSYEKVITDSCTREYNYINSPVGPVAVIITEGETETLYYLETDHLGSIIGLIDNTGTKVESFSFDAWGRRRNPADWSYDSIPAPALIDRGFTGHEHLDEFDLINMNGRIYDPYTGRFLSVDPIIQFPDNALSFNGYVYCFNNPLVLLDSSGMDCKVINNSHGSNTDIIQQFLQSFLNNGASFAGLNLIDFENDTYLEGLINDYYGDESGTSNGLYVSVYVPGISNCKPIIVPKRLLSRPDLLAEYLRSNLLVPTIGGLAINFCYHAEAIYSDVGFTFVGTGMAKGEIFILAERNAGEVHSYKELGVGVGTSLALSGEIGRIDYSGNPDDFKPNFIYGNEPKHGSVQESDSFLQVMHTQEVISHSPMRKLGLIHFKLGLVQQLLLMQGLMKELFIIKAYTNEINYSPKILVSIFMILLIIIVFSIDSIRTNKIQKRYLNEYPALTIDKELNGIISQISKEDLLNFKSNPYEASLVINDSVKFSVTAKDISNSWSFDKIVTVGDCIIKNKGSDDIYILRFNYNDTLKFVFKLYNLSRRK